MSCSAAQFSLSMEKFYNLVASSVYYSQNDQVAIKMADIIRTFFRLKSIFKISTCKNHPEKGFHKL